MSPNLDNEVSQVPVTALAQPWHDLVFAGQGPVLKIYDRLSTELILSTRIFANQAIHGFTYDLSHENSTILLLAWGGRHVGYCEVSREEASKTSAGYKLSISQKAIIKISDWVFDISFRSKGNVDSTQTPGAVLVTAHNEIFELQRPIREHEFNGDTPALAVTKVFSGPRCGLYSATLKWISSQHLLAISGTAFGEIVVWSLNFQGLAVEARRHYVFTGHEGSIFGVRVSDELTTPNGARLRLLASCSDDRTIRMWHISDLHNGLVLGKDEVRASERDSSRTTGFLNYVSEEAAAASSELCIATGMGHLSRIWDIRFVTERGFQKASDYVCSIISVGEDATCQKWHLKQETVHEGRYKLSHAASNDLHDGKNVWSVITKQMSSHPCILTGGADGQIVEHSSLSGSEDGSHEHLAISEWEIEETLDAVDADSELERTTTKMQKLDRGFSNNTREKPKQDCFRSFAAIGNSQLLITTNDGLVLLATTTHGNTWTWKRVASFDGLKGYSVACHLVAEPFEYVFFGDAQGNIYYYHSFFETVKLLTNVDGKITKLIAEILPSRTHEYMSIVVTRHGGHPPVQLRINLGTGGNIHLASTKFFARWTPDFPQITSAVVATHDSTEKGLIIGCRNGTIFSYSRIESPGKREFDFQLPLSHGKEAVTAMMWVPHGGYQENMWSPSFGWLYSVGRDGAMTIHHFEGIYKDPVLVHRLSLSFGPNLEGITIEPSTLDISVWGFTSKYFKCQNVSAQEDVVTVECGGAHRIWNFAPLKLPSDGTAGGLFAWIKAMKLNLAKIHGPSHKVIQSGDHGREIKTCASAPVSIHRGLGPLIATGAEDTNIAISYFADWHGGQKQLKRLSVLRKHVTGVQSLHWSSDGHFLFSCGGFGEFYVWHLRSVPAVSIGIVCESKCPLDSMDSELRITDFAVRDIAVRERSSLGDEQWVFLISMVYSDSSIKVWKYTSTDSVVPDRHSWSFVAITQYTTACLTAAAHLSTNSTGWPLVTGATDGHLVFWSLSDRTRNLACEGLQSIHQSSIKAIATTEVTDNSWLVVSGGDDNALGFTILTTKDETSEYATSSLIVPSAHGAAVNAIGIFKRNRVAGQQASLGMHVVTASNDQVVRLWDVMIDPRKPGIKGVAVRKQGRYCSAVADISSVAIFARPRRDHQAGDIKILVSGVGTEVWAYGPIQ